MRWLSTAIYEPVLPAHCEPANDFLLRFSSAFHTCIPTPLAFTSNLFGTLSIIAWLFAQLPQIYKNYSIGSTSGLSIFFLAEWFLGDLGNLLGALFTHQASWQVTIGAYYCFVDLCLLGQWMWYEKLRHGNMVLRIQPGAGGGRAGAGRSGQDGITTDGLSVERDDPGHGNEDSLGDSGLRKQRTRPRIIFHTPTFEKERKDKDGFSSSSLSATSSGSTIYRVGSSSPMPSPSPRTVLLIACVIAMAQASPVGSYKQTIMILQSAGGRPTGLESAGTVLSWISTVCYLGSRLPQLYKNWRRKSTAGLSPHLFVAAFCGNLLYSSALLTNPCAWQDFAPFGGGGWVGTDGSERKKWILAALPFFLGAAGVLGLDASVGLQFMAYGDNTAKMVVAEEGRDRRWHWRTVSGWMRGWVPSVGEMKNDEREALVVRTDQHSDGYGTTLQ